MAIENLRNVLKDQHITYSVIHHSPAYTAQEIAARAHVPGKEMAKTVLVKIDGKMVMAVLPAHARLDLDLLKREATAKRIEMANEEEFKYLFPDCEIGAMPPFGSLYGMDTYVADTLTQDEHICFNAGTHQELIKLAYKDYADVVHPKIVHCCADRH